MIKLFLMLLIFIIIGCGDCSDKDSSSKNFMSNEEVIAEVQKCEQAGLKAMAKTNYHEDVIKIICLPK